ncbi:RNA recognition motif-containing protein [Toxoplasma gondii TgCatPRC2]|uniref:RNA recognition motif-containing protein n=6 Tax=Toxoplasma gondii TaxID=5811 RepID=A0A151HNV7_TOXGO|nr:RNA recognition motif-containing protein [Toxoplasma gondii ME49]KFH05917.1 RNA recognition motif-containing protein [Toxoplasma gondii VAND]KFH16646.1 RNA recognition motif-containing protein [Toxoplasma gondii MAS]KYF46792.1 RNA recognition motif-containing protein [Toxoplasma gondii ARI]KYK71055.1 RNA recognition motif-containing protein [Toxoplasma gondii TgCatPRC2]PIM01197.1 RNA recognition motif-containing protein [Toxoplasma gondii COUG]|eukprot:XP_002365730.1 RNA recognition motif-containing protein [Toxoplasma gondii ME49]
MATGCSLLIRNLCFETSPDRVRQIFEKFGRVRDVYLPLDHFTKRPRGFGFVEFYEESTAQEAMREMDRTMIDGNEVHVIIAQDRRKSPETMRRHLEQTRRGGAPDRDFRRRDDFRGGRGYARGDIREVDIRYAEANGMRPGDWGPGGGMRGYPPVSRRSRSPRARGRRSHSREYDSSRYRRDGYDRPRYDRGPHDGYSRSYRGRSRSR